MTPYYDKIVIEPIKRESFIESVDLPLQEVGTVISVGEQVDFCKPGDILLFSSWGCLKTEYDGSTYYIVTEQSEFILGKITVKKKKNGPVLE